MSDDLTRKPPVQENESDRAAREVESRGIFLREVEAQAHCEDITPAAVSLHDRIVAAHQGEKSRSTRTVDWRSFDAGFRAALRGDDA